MEQSSERSRQSKGRFRPRGGLCFLSRGATTGPSSRPLESGLNSESSLARAPGRRRDLCQGNDLSGLPPRQPNFPIVAGPAVSPVLLLRASSGDLIAAVRLLDPTGVQQPARVQNRTSPDTMSSEGVARRGQAAVPAEGPRACSDSTVASSASGRAPAARRPLCAERQSASATACYRVRVKFQEP